MQNGMKPLTVITMLSVINSNRISFHTPTVIPNYVSYGIVSQRHRLRFPSHPAKAHHDAGFDPLLPHSPAEISLPQDGQTSIAAFSSDQPSPKGWNYEPGRV